MNTQQLVDQLKEQEFVTEVNIINDGKIGQDLAHMITVSDGVNRRSFIALESKFTDVHSDLEIYPLSGRDLTIEEIMQKLF